MAKKKAKKVVAKTKVSTKAKLAAKSAAKKVAKRVKPPAAKLVVDKDMFRVLMESPVKNAAQEVIRYELVPYPQTPKLLDESTAKTYMEELKGQGVGGKLIRVPATSTEEVMVEEWAGVGRVAVATAEEQAQPQPVTQEKIG